MDREFSRFSFLKFMEIVYIKKLDYLKVYKYVRTIDPDTNLLLSVGESVSKDSIISKGSISKMSYRIKVSDFSSNYLKYIDVLHGEIIHKGDSIVKKRKKTIFSPVDGIIDLSHLSSGFIMIKSYPEEIVNKSNINGIISDISENKDKITIDTAVLKIDLKYIFGESQESSFKYLSDDKGFLSLDRINTSVVGSIIYVGNLITMEIIKKSLAVGVVGVIGNGIEIRNNESIEEFVNSIPLTVGVIDGFGIIENSYFYNILPQYELNSVLIDQNSQALIIPTDKNLKEDKAFEIKEISINDLVQVFSFPYWGFSGIVKSIDIYNRSALISLDSGGDINVQIDEIVGII